jgi:tetratricopeptide (TPR) repeat protein
VTSKFLKTDILKGRKNPPLALLCRFTKLGSSYMMYGAREQALETAEITIPYLEKMVEKHRKQGLKPGRNKINEAGEAIYYLAACYELKANALDYEANPDESKAFFEEAVALYSKLNAESSKEIVEMILQKLSKAKIEQDARP